MKKNILILVSLIILTVNAAYTKGYNMQFPLSGDSIANDALQLKIVKKIYNDALKEFPACMDYDISDTQIVHYPYDVVKKNNRYKEGYWKEIWTLNACGMKKQIPLTFNIHNYKTTYTIECLSK